MAAPATLRRDAGTKQKELEGVAGHPTTGSFWPAPNALPLPVPNHLPICLAFLIYSYAAASASDLDPLGKPTSIDSINIHVTKQLFSLFKS